MKLAVLGDAHGNLAALETVTAHIERWRPDAVVVAGDIVNRGPRSLECWQFVRNKQVTDGWQVVRGNHEDYVIQFAQPERTLSEEAFELYRPVFWTYQQLDSHVPELTAMPPQVDLSAPNQDPVRIVHASVHDNRDGVYPKSTDEELRHKIRLPGQPAPSLFCTAHTHWPLTRHVDETLVVNVGSVGLPFDGDTRAAYGQLTWQQGHWQAEIIRLDYDRQRTEQDFVQTGYLTGGGPIARLILDELRIARPHMFNWTQLFQEAILAGDITIEAAVNEYMANNHGKRR